MNKFILLGLAGITGLICQFGPSDAGREPNVKKQAVHLSEHAMTLYSLGMLERAKTDFATARMTLSQTMGPRNPATLSVRNNYAAVLFAMGDYAQAEAEHRGTMNLRDSTLGRLDLESIASRHNLAITLMREGKYAEAYVHERCVESARRHLLGRNDPKSRQARRLRMLIEDAMKDGKPGSAPSGIGSSGILPA